MYIVDFFKRITRKSNIPILIYLVLNIFVIALILQSLFYASFAESLLIGLVLYAFSMTIALSPIGEWILRIQTGCHKIKRVEQLDFIKPIFDEVYEKAKNLDPSIPDDVHLFINGDENPNAFATGRKTICITEGMLRQPKEQIKAALAHEFGHLAHKDTDLILVVTIGNFFVTAIITIIKLILIGINLVVSLAGEGIAGAISSVLTVIFVDALMWVWTKIGTALVMKSTRSNEYEADEFSFKLGYGDSLCAFLDSFGHSGTKGLFATLESSHPDKNDRIARMQELGSSYRNSYGTETASANKSQSVNGKIKEPAQLTATIDSSDTSDASNSPASVAYCINCGAKISENAKFCPRCGSKIER